MSEISATDLAIIQDQVFIHSKVLLSWHKVALICHQASQFVSFRNALEAIAAGERSNADLSVLARKTLEKERADRPTVKRKSKPLVRLEAVT